MIRFSANLGLLFADVPLRERFQKAAEAGFRVVEIWFPYDENLTTKDLAGLKLLQFNMDRIDFAGGERGTMAIPDQSHRFRADLEEAITIARHLGCRQFNALAGNLSPKFSPAEHVECLKSSLRWASERLANTGLRLVVEPLSLALNPGYMMPLPSKLLAIVAEINSPNLVVQYDIFHAHMAGEEIVPTLRRYLPWIGHIQVADAPGRHEPGTGEIDYRFVFGEIEAMGYDGYIGLEFRPLKTIWPPPKCRVETTSHELFP